MRSDTRISHGLAVVAVLALLGVSAAPLVEHLCDRADVVVAAHDCCGDHCPGHPAAPPEGEAPAAAQTLCCVQMPPGPLRAAPALSPVAQGDLTLAPAADAVPSGAPPAVRPLVATDASPPPASLRAHVLHAVWLI